MLDEQAARIDRGGGLRVPADGGLPCTQRIVSTHCAISARSFASSIPACGSQRQPALIS